MAFFFLPPLAPNTSRNPDFIRQQGGRGQKHAEWWPDNSAAPPTAGAATVDPNQIDSLAYNSKQRRNDNSPLLHAVLAFSAGPSGASEGVRVRKSGRQRERCAAWRATSWMNDCSGVSVVKKKKTQKTPHPSSECLHPLHMLIFKEGSVRYYNHSRI